MPIIQSVERALMILELFDEQHEELRITEISAMMNLHKSTVHSLLKTLQLHGYIDQDEETGKYRLGLKLLERGQLILRQLDLRTAAARHLRQLSEETGQTVHLVILDGKEGIYIDKVEGKKAAIRYSRIGRRVPLHSSAVGKVLAAFRSDAEIAELLQNYEFVRQTPRTIQSAEAFLKELEAVRKRGYAVDDEENEPGVRCVAAPIFDHNGQTAAAMSISTMTAHVNDEELAELAAKLGETARQISGKLGYG